MSFSDWLQGSNSSESSESLQSLRSSTSCSVLPTSAASRPISKRKCADSYNRDSVITNSTYL